MSDERVKPFLQVPIRILYFVCCSRQTIVAGPYSHFVFCVLFVLLVSLLSSFHLFVVQSAYPSDASSVAERDITSKLQGELQRFAAHEGKAGAGAKAEAKGKDAAQEVCLSRCLSLFSCYYFVLVNFTVSADVRAVLRGRGWRKGGRRAGDPRPQGGLAGKNTGIHL